jgi:glycosyltransferase involved in cell wall biosynthesis
MSDRLPNIGIVIATPGRASIYRTLRSILYQGLLSGDDILVVGDGFHQPTKDLVEAFGPPFRYVATEPTRDWGHSQLTWGLKHVKGDIVTYQDDDDIYLPRALEEMRRMMAKHPNAPMVGRVKTPFRGLLWWEAGIKTLLDGHCLVAPNDKKKLGYVTSEYHGDQVYISTTIAHYPDLNWVDRVWTLTRPTWKLFPKRGPAPQTYQDNFFREMCERLPSVAGRPLNGDNDWFWTFYSQDRGLKHPVAAVKLFEEEGRAWATVSYVPGDNTDEVVEEIVEFASWAGQGCEVWFGTLADDKEIIAELKKRGYKDHMIGRTNHDYTMAWPPKWFPQDDAVELLGPDGMHIPDWRDKF